MAAITQESVKPPLKNIGRFTPKHFIRSSLGDGVQSIDVANIVDSAIDNSRGSAKKQFALQDVKLTSINKNVLSVKDDTSKILKTLNRIEKKIGGPGGASSPTPFRDSDRNGDSD
jgi:hypothetical protein